MTKLLEFTSGRLRSPLLHQLFMKIAEPRVIRIMHFGIYICMINAGIGVLGYPPTSFENLVGSTWVYALGWFLITGGVFSAAAVLPGVWWLERVGIILIATSIAVSIFIISTLGYSAIGVAIALAFLLTFALRWMEIRRYQLAPRES